MSDQQGVGIQPSEYDTQLASLPPQLRVAALYRSGTPGLPGQLLLSDCLTLTSVSGGVRSAPDVAAAEADWPQSLIPSVPLQARTASVWRWPQPPPAWLYCRVRPTDLNPWP